MAEQSLYQGYQNWAFEQQIAGDSAVTFVQYVRECTPFGFLFGKVDSERAAALGIRGGHKSPVPAKGERLAVGSTVGRLTIPRLNLAAVVREGTDPEILKRSVGHVPVTALPGQTGNFAIAAHRDTLFRGLKDVRVQDEVVVETQSERFVYRVIATEIVSPSDVSVLRADGGGVRAIQAGPNEKPGPSKLLTMITCYPFNFVGSAPKRFIVEASMISAVRVHNTLASTSM